jgi:hypothetical protein
MTLIQIYLLGVCSEAIYMYVKWRMWSKEKRSKFMAELEALDAKHSWWWAIPLMCLLWPYNLLIAFIKMIGK